MKLKTIPTISELLEACPELETTLFDMDGTLLNSEVLHSVATKSFLKDFIHSFKGDIEELEKTCSGLSDPQLVEFFNSKFNLNINLEDLIKSKETSIVSLLETQTHDELLHPDMRNLLKELKENKINIGLVTSSEREITHILLEVLKIKDSFQHIITRNDVSETKPSPVPYLQAMEYFNTHPDKTIIFEDSPVGLKAANSSGVKAIIQALWY